MTWCPDNVIGEVVEASVTVFTAQARELDRPPALGELVRIGEAPVVDDPFGRPTLAPDAIYAVVVDACTGSIDPGRRAIAYWLAAEQLRAQQPQIAELMASTFRCVLLAHCDRGRLRRSVPSRPPALHAFVQPCAPEEICELTEQVRFLRTVLMAADCPSADAAVAALVRRAAECHADGDEFLVRAGKQLALLLQDDFERLSAILRQLEE